MSISAAAAEPPAVAGGDIIRLRPSAAAAEQVVDSFEEFFGRVLPRALRVARRILGDQTQAEDAAAEAFARAHASWKRIGASSYSDAWILRVTANVAIDMGRRRQWLSASGLRPEPRQQVAESEHDTGLTRIALAAALAELPRRQREVVVLRYLEALSEEEVSSALRISPGSVKKHAFRARETLRRRLGSEFDPEGNE